MQVAAKLEKESGLSIDPREMNLQTLRQFAAALDERMGQLPESRKDGLTRKLLVATKSVLVRGRKGQDNS